MSVDKINILAYFRTKWRLLYVYQGLTWHSPIYDLHMVNAWSYHSWYALEPCQTCLVSPCVLFWAALLLAKIQTMAQPNLPDMLATHTKKAELGITTVYNKQQLIQWDVMETQKRWQVEYKNSYRRKPSTKHSAKNRKINKPIKPTYIVVFLYEMNHLSVGTCYGKPFQMTAK